MFVIRSGASGFAGAYLDLCAVRVALFMWRCKSALHLHGCSQRSFSASRRFTAFAMRSAAVVAAICMTGKKRTCTDWQYTTTVYLAVVLVVVTPAKW